LNEYRSVPLLLFGERKINRSQLKALIGGIASFVSVSEVVYPRKTFTVCRDVEDNMLLECCFEAKASILVTGDKDLLEVKSLPFELRILSPRTFVEDL
jgi:putative PIN family toxin of toxin-antitoxin system